MLNSIIKFCIHLFTYDQNYVINKTMFHNLIISKYKQYSCRIDTVNSEYNKIDDSYKIVQML